MRLQVVPTHVLGINLIIRNELTDPAPMVRVAAPTGSQFLVVVAAAAAHGKPP